MGITIGSNISSLRAQRKLADTSSVLSRTFERLASGQKINRASDDAAGIAIVSALNVNCRVFSQAIRNLNDGLSLLNVASGAMQELKTVLVRQRELATQSSSGTYINQQRAAMEAEVQALSREYNRIIQGTEFNGRRILSAENRELVIQCGEGTAGTLVISLGTESITPEAITDTGTFGPAAAYASGIYPLSLAIMDVNNDSAPDMVTTESIFGTASVFLGHGDGTFSTRTSFVIPAGSRAIAAGYIDNDSNIDVAIVESGSSSANVFLGNGNGTFGPPMSFATGNSPYDVALIDLDGDLVLDLVTADAGANRVSVRLGNGNGTFGARTSYQTWDSPYSVATLDLNGDTLPDVVTSDNSSHRVSVFLGGGDGLLGARASFATGNYPRSLALLDLNGDSAADIVTTDSGSDRVSVLLGNGNGTFAARRSFTTGAGPGSVCLMDLNGDFIPDIVTADTDANRASVFLGNGNGTFAARTSYVTGNAPAFVVLADLNGDTAPDMVTADRDSNRVSVFLANTATIPASITNTGLELQSGISVATLSSALSAQGRIDGHLEKVNNIMGVIGGSMSRIAVALANLGTTVENSRAAAGRIMDADVAEESSILIRTQILQQAASAVLSQANQQPGLALQVLGAA